MELLFSFPIRYNEYNLRYSHYIYSWVYKKIMIFTLSCGADVDGCDVGAGDCGADVGDCGADA